MTVERKQTLTEVVVIVVVLILCLLLLFTPAHCSIATGVKHNATGALSYDENPITYKEGRLVAATYVADGKGIVVRIQPKDTFFLFSEDILFCNNSSSADKINGKANPVVLAYETQAHTALEGIGCHRLLSVDEVKQPKEELQ